jgi:uncharacterized DUF497 family protein
LYVQSVGAIAYTPRLRTDDRPVLWDGWNERHIVDEHPERGLTAEEVGEAMSDPERVETETVLDGVSHQIDVGRTASGRLLVVVWIDDRGGRYPIHARLAGRRAARRYYR